MLMTLSATLVLNLRRSTMSFRLETLLASRSGLGSEFDKFLFAVVGDDRNGMHLSVVSVLARMDLDPWQEAATLAALPEELAAQRLAPLLAALPQPTLQQTSAATMAARLVALLPRRTNTNTRLAVPETDGVSALHPKDQLIPLIPIVVAIYLILSLGIQFFGVRRDSTVRTNTVHMPATPAAPSQTSPPTSGK
jgi:hypothetical protein